MCTITRVHERRSPHDVPERREEGCFRIFVSRYLMDDDKKFREYFRVSRDLIQIILSYIEEDISVKPYNPVSITKSSI